MHRRRPIRPLCALAIAACALAAAVDVARADTTTGAIKGVARDTAQGDEPLAGVAVAVSSHATGATYTTDTDEQGGYEVTNLPPGSYTVLFIYMDLTVRRADVVVRLGRTTPVHVGIDTDKIGAGTIIDMTGKPPAIDWSPKQGISIDQDYLRHIPVPGRTWADSLGVAPGSSGDQFGIAFSGSSSLESVYIVDGLNTTGLNFGNAGGALLNDFVEETEIITGGYNAEFGRSTGGVVNVVTKSGGNEIRGSVFSYGTTAFLTAAAKRPAEQQTSIEADANLAYDADVGFEIGGPIAKDRAFFYLGFAPRFRKIDVDRVTQRRRDENQDGMPDLDANGFPIYDEIDRTRLADTRTSYQFVSKVNLVVDADHQGQVAFTATPASGTSIGIRGEPSAVRRTFSSLATDASMKWTSKLLDGKARVEATVGWHRVASRSGSATPGMAGVTRQDVLFGDLADHGIGGRESAATLAACRDSGADVDRYPLIDNCPDEGLGYSLGGIGGLQDDTEERRMAKLVGSHRVRAAGHHLFKVGVDAEDNRSTVPRSLSGGALHTVVLPNLITQPRVETARFARLDPVDGGNICGYPTDELGNDILDQPILCDYIRDAAPVTGRTFNWSAFVQDSWSIRPNLSLNAGLRYEEQRLRYSEELQGTTDPITGDQLGVDALVMRNMWAPRLGIIYDWTKQGRSKVYGHWGRFYESIPMRINERSFGGETFLRSIYGIGQCGDPVDVIDGPSGDNCPEDERPDFGYDLLGSGVLVAPGIKPQYMDEVVLGAEVEVYEDLRVGIAYKDRRLGRVLEDVSTDNAQTYIIANPGELDEGEEAALQAEIDALPVGDPARDELERRLEMFRGVRKFDKASRDYQAIEVTAHKRFGNSFYLQAAYTYSRTRGNFPGLFSPDTGQLDPNITSQFDLIELLANRDGPLPQDRPHYVKFDGYYTFDLGKWGRLTPGARFRALSGTPIDALGMHYLYGRGESYLLPRGSVGRTPFDTEVDLKLSYGRQLSDGIAIEVFGDVFNLLNNQAQTRVDEEYTLDPANPIVGGSASDLIYLKRTTLVTGLPTAEPVGRKLNFGNTSQRLTPLSARFGVRLTF